MSNKTTRRSWMRLRAIPPIPFLIWVVGPAETYATSNLWATTPWAWTDRRNSWPRRTVNRLPTGFFRRCMVAVARAVGVLVYTLGEAARASGKSKSTIAKAIKTGRLSALRGDEGSYQIDPAELHRVYPVTGATNGSGARSDAGSVDGALDAGAPGELAKWRALAIEREETIRDLRTRLDAAAEDLRQEAEERRRVQERL